MTELRIRAQEGPQRGFGACEADIAFYGGSAGAGKSFVLVLEAGRNADNPEYNGIIFRRTAPEITGGGGLWDESFKLYPYLGDGGRAIENRLVWKFRSSASIQFSHLQYAKDVFAHQGRQYAFIGFDELTHFEESQFWYLVSRNRTTCGIRPYMRATTNPAPGTNKRAGWIRRFISWWIGEDGYPILERSGVLRWFVRIEGEIHWASSPEELRAKFSHLPPEDVLPLSFTFIAAKLSDNKILTTKDPTYRAKLLALPLVERMRLLGDAERGGNWDVEPAAGLYFKRSYFEIVDEPPEKVIRRCRGWDKAATEPSEENPDPDWTAGLKYSRDQNGLFYIEDAVIFRGSPATVEKRVVNTANQDGKGTIVGLWQDPGSAGKSEADHYVRLLGGFRTHVERASMDKVTYAGPVSSQAERGNLKIVRGPWNDRVLSELEVFPEGAHDDVADGLSVAHIVVAADASDWLRRINKWR
jgi:predicted phage terminase large subunit-like protein